MSYLDVAFTIVGQTGMQTITAAESGAGAHHFDCWKRLEQQNPQNDRLTKKENHCPKQCKPQAKKQATLQLLMGYI